MKNIIIDTVDYDYPSCGGITVSKGRKLYTVEISSNYQGNTTGAILTYPINHLSDIWEAADWEELAQEVLYDPQSHPLWTIKNRGYKVQ